MEAVRSSASRSFGEEHFGACVFGDARLTARAVHTADRMMQHPGGTLPDKFNDNASLMGMYRLANNDKVTHEAIMAGHFARTREIMGSIQSVVLVLHDTTEADFSGLDSVAGLGPIGNGGCRGFLVHNLLAYDYDAAEVIGLANQVPHVRRKVPKNETPRQKREHPGRESRLWNAGHTGMGLPPEGTFRVNVSDRGSDVFEYIEAVERTPNDHYCIRSKSNRLIELEDGKGGRVRAKLHDWARKLPTLGMRQIDVKANHYQTARETTVRVAAAQVALRAPKHARGKHSRESVTCWVIHVAEINPPKGCSPLEWILLTNVATEGFDQACVRVDWYARRSVVEEYHKAMKTGCGVEEQQFTTLKALQVTLGILSVVAVQLLRLRDMSRREDARTRPAADVIDQPYIDLLSLWRFKTLRPDMTVYDFCRALSKLGGHLNRTHDRDAGWLVLWRGWTKLQLLVEGAQAAERRRCV